MKENIELTEKINKFKSNDLIVLDDSTYYERAMKKSCLLEFKRFIKLCKLSYIQSKNNYINYFYKIKDLNFLY